MTAVNGLRLAYRGFVAGLAGAYVWAAVVMTLSWLLEADPLAPLRPIALAISPLAGSPELAFVLGLAGIQAAGALVGMCFAYFMARFFTIRATMRIGAPVTAVLAWGLIAAVLEAEGAAMPPTFHAVAVIGAIGYGLLLGARVPLRGEVARV
ncbi:MAG: hypothetical protein ACXWWU_09065 [Candidatus Limnocylindria bacterium]